ncbi:alkaline phosphatase family protein [Nocardia sp. NEAU-G5]|uniref:Alkaline phosphatase family protein n=1 Tax=Nocardia albiluteola TaxID=2842303 RepID=A0ABS6AZT3_9NOCA|nr:alkaline phosphatase family protein [Nocardia albiluteola]MBU3063504.1 alkaline phosphatase family protein [Nocardia albiluteola]
MTRRFTYFCAVVALVVSALTTGASRPAAAAVPSGGHVFIIQLENKGFDETWGASSAAPYLSRTLRAQGVLLSQYYGIGHNSLDNYIAQISGQGPNTQTQADCQIYTDFAATGTVPPQQAVGQGCVYPTSVHTLAGQLSAAGKTWKGYMEDMGTPCRHPAIGTQDTTQKATTTSQYAARHNPFVYFHEIIDSPDCQSRDVDLTALKTDLAQPSTTPNLSFITPNLCDDGHDSPCVTGAPGGLASADSWLRQWVPVIASAPAFQQDGVLIITFDESDGPQQDASACCGEGPGPNAALPGLTGMGGGRVGALVISPRYTAPNTWSDTPYNHYSLLASIEDTFGLPHLGYAASPGLPRFGTDVFNRKN